MTKKPTPRAVSKRDQHAPIETDVSRIRWMLDQHPTLDEFHERPLIRPTPTLLDSIDLGDHVTVNDVPMRVSGIATRPPTPDEIEDGFAGPDDRIRELTVATIREPFAR